MLAADVVGGVLGDDVGVVLLALDALAVDVEGVVVVLGLALVRDPVVEAGAFFIGLLIHMELADVGGFVAGGAKLAGIAGEVGGIIGEIVDDLVGVGIEAGKHGRAAGRAEGGGAEEVAEDGAFGGEAI